MDRAQRRRIQPGQRIGDDFGVGRALRLLFFESRAHTVAQLRGRSLRKRDCDDAVDRPAVEHQRNVAVDQGAGLARTGAGLDEQRLVQRLADQAARSVIGRLGVRNRRHGCSPFATRAMLLHGP